MNEIIRINHGFWWLWGLSLAAFTSTISQPLPLALIAAGVIFLAFQRSHDSKALQNFSWLLKVAFWLATFRFALQIIFGTPMGSQVLFELPIIELPNFLAGLRIGGQVTLESLHFGLVQALRISTLVVVISGIATIANPKLLLEKPLRGFSEISLLSTLTINFLPQLATDASRIKNAARWRGDNSNRVMRLARGVIPLTETALDRSVNLGAALSLRGYANAKPDPINRNLLLAAIGAMTLWFGLYVTDQLHIVTSVAILTFIGWTTLHISKAAGFKTKFQPNANWAAPFIVTFTVIANSQLHLFDSAETSWILASNFWALSVSTVLFVIGFARTSEGANV